jgi:hypothetical protein
MDMKAVAYSSIALLLLAAPAFGRQPAQQNANPLVGGKLMYVGHMPQNLDNWIVADLRAWGKYKPTRDPEGVDLVMELQEPEKKVEHEISDGSPQPKQVEKAHGPQHLMFSIVVGDWVTRQPVWQADILDRKPKNGRRQTTTGSHSEIYARGLSTPELAEEILRTLRAYVNQLSR